MCNLRCETPMVSCSVIRAPIPVHVHFSSYLTAALCLPSLNTSSPCLAGKSSRPMVHLATHRLATDQQPIRLQLNQLTISARNQTHISLSAFTFLSGFQAATNDKGLRLPQATRVSGCPSLTHQALPGPANHLLPPLPPQQSPQPA